MPFIFLPPLAVMLVGLLAFGILAANYYYSNSHTQSFWATIADFSTIPGALKFWTRKAAVLFSKVTSKWMAEAVNAVDAPIGTGFHWVAGIFRVAGETFQGISAFALTAAEAITGVVTWREIAAQLRRLHHIIARAEHAASIALHRVIAQEGRLAHTIAHGVYPRIRAIEHEIARPLHREIKATRHLAREAEEEALRAFKVAKHALARTSVAALVVAIPAVLARLGLDWINCRSAKNMYRKRGCGMWDDLDALLGLAVLTVGAVSFEELVRAAQGLTEEGVQDFKDVFGL